MQIEDPVALLDSLRGLPRETDWVEFKANRFNAESIGQYVSALANSAMFHEKDHAYLVFGVEDGTHDIIGTDIDLAGKTVGGEPFLFWLAKLLDPKLAVRHVPFDYEGKRVDSVCRPCLSKAGKVSADSVHQGRIMHATPCQLFGAGARSLADYFSIYL